VAKLNSRTLGNVEIRRTRSGTKLLVGGVLYAIRPPRPSATPMPWIVLAAAPWVHDRALSPGPRIGFLGYGAGTVARLVRGLSRSAELVGVEPDPVVRRVAARSFGAGELGVRILAEDAGTHLSRGRSLYDALLDDIFVPTARGLGRPEGADQVPELARGRLRPGGIYAVNLASPGGRAESRTVECVMSSFRNAIVIHPREYAHKIVVASDISFRPGAIRQAVRGVLHDPAVSMERLGLGRVRILKKQ
jgi:hypothetical protein